MKVTPSNNKQQKDIYTGFIVMRLINDYNYEDNKGFFQDEEQIEVVRLSILNNLLSENPPINIKPLINNVSPKRIKKIEDLAKLSSFPPIRSLTTYWHLDYRNRNKEELETILINLNNKNISVVDFAYKQIVPTDPLPSTETNDYTNKQDYLKSPPKGLNVEEVNAKGENVGLIDLEQGWDIEPDQHEDLPNDKIKLLKVNHVFENRHNKGNYIGEHGIMTLGIIVAKANRKGITGIAPETNPIKLISYYRKNKSYESSYNVPGTIVEVISRLVDREINVGDILLLEVQKNELPTETQSADFDAIRLASALGLIVIEPSGNNKEDLDKWMDNGKDKLNREYSNHFQDSGAIMVGGAVLYKDIYYNIYNFGSRIDCFASGNNVFTTGGNKGWEQGKSYRRGRLRDMKEKENQGYEPDAPAIDDPTTSKDNYSYFNGTSAASAIIAGAAILVQSAYKAANNQHPLAPLQMRYLLKNSGIQANEIKIGRMPDLKQIIGNDTEQGSMHTIPYAYIKSNEDDEGVVPLEGGEIGETPDILISNNGEIVSPFENGTSRNNLTERRDFFVYLRLKSKNGAVNNVEVKLFLKKDNNSINFENWKRIAEQDTSEYLFDIPNPDSTTLTLRATTIDNLESIEKIKVEWQELENAIQELGNRDQYYLVVILKPEEYNQLLIPTSYEPNVFDQFVRNNNNVACLKFTIP